MASRFCREHHREYRSQFRSRPAKDTHRLAPMLLAHIRAARRGKEVVPGDFPFRQPIFRPLSAYNPLIAAHSGRTDGKIVVVTLWSDQFRNREYKWSEYLPSKPGYRELMKSLSWAQAHCEGRFSVIMAIPKPAKNRAARYRGNAVAFRSERYRTALRLDW